MAKTDVSKRYLIKVPCESCPEGHHFRYAASGLVPWSSEKAARRHIDELTEYGYETAGFEVVEHQE